MQIKREHDGKEGVVTGTPEELLRFYLVWQTNMWPDWVMTDLAGGRSGLLRDIENIKGGSVTFDLSGDICRTAFSAAENALKHRG